MKHGTVFGILVVSAVMLLAGIAFFVAAAPAPGHAADEAKQPKDPFDKNVIDIGVIVSDVAKTAAFYTEALGFTELKGFEVTAEMSKEAGLTDGQPISVRVFTTADKDKSTKIKIMEFRKTPPKKVENTYLNSSLGFRYLTVYVNDTTAAVARAKKAGAKLTEPYTLADGKTFLTLVRDPDGNIIELIGPKL
jgi:lactoylglutathione lyase